MTCPSKHFLKNQVAIFSRKTRPTDNMFTELLPKTSITQDFFIKILLYHICPGERNTFTCFILQGYRKMSTCSGHDCKAYSSIFPETVMGGNIFQSAACGTASDRCRSRKESRPPRGAKGWPEDYGGIIKKGPISAN